MSRTGSQLGETRTSLRTIHPRPCLVLMAGPTKGASRTHDSWEVRIRGRAAHIPNRPAYCDPSMPTSRTEKRLTESGGTRMKARGVLLSWAPGNRSVQMESRLVNLGQALNTSLYHNYSKPPNLHPLLKQRRRPLGSPVSAGVGLILTHPMRLLLRATITRNLDYLIQIPQDMYSHLADSSACLLHRTLGQPYLLARRLSNRIPRLQQAPILHHLSLVTKFPQLTTWMKTRLRCRCRVYVKHSQHPPQWINLSISNILTSGLCLQEQCNPPTSEPNRKPPSLKMQDRSCTTPLPPPIPPPKRVSLHASLYPAFSPSRYPPLAVHQD